MKTTLRSSNTLYRICALPMDIFDDEMVRVVLHMASNVANYGCIHIFVTTSPRVPSEDVEAPVEIETSFRANMSGPDNEKEVLPRTMSLQQYYSPIHDNNDNIGDNDIALKDVGEEVLPLTHRWSTSILRITTMISETLMIMLMRQKRIMFVLNLLIVWGVLI